MNISEIILDLHINSLYLIKNTSSKYQITSNQLVLLYAIPFTGISQSDLSNKLTIDVSTMSRNLDKLINSELVYKEYDQYDKRQTNIKLTNKGEKLYHDFMNDLSYMLDNFNLDFDESELEKSFNLLLQINWYLSKKKL
tara:strand:+ start:398 stop:814 length:417 start_codon:yes stop_codon:yes gene_type:complete